MAFSDVLYATYEALKVGGKLLGSIAKNPLYTLSYRDAIAKGKLKDGRQAQIEGYTVGITTSTKDISELATTTIPTPSLSGVNMSIVSTSANDTLAGSNSQKVVVEYIEPTTEILTQIEVDLNGTTYVDIPVPIAFVSDFYVSQSASLDTVSAGDITIVDTATKAIVYNKILAGGNKSLQLYRYVPKGKALYIAAAIVTSTTKAVNVRLRANVNDNGTKTTGFIFRTLCQTNEGSTVIIYDPPMWFPEQTYIKASMFAGANDASGSVSVMLNGWLENK